MLPQRSAELPQNSLYLAQVPKEKNGVPKCHLWKFSSICGKRAKCLIVN
jgi:hypothetical protein